MEVGSTVLRADEIACYVFAALRKAENGRVVSCAGVRKRYGLNRPWVLKGIDAEVSAGQIIHVGGSNGAGKSTLLRIVSGASVPTDGDRELAPGARVGYVPENTSPPRGLSAGRYLRHHARLRGLRTGAGEEVERLAGALRCEHFLPQPLTTLSRGSLRKFSLIQALLGAPRLLVLDEPFTGLDVSAQEALAGLLAERARNGAAVVFSDHREGGRQMAATERWEIVAGVRREEAGVPAAAGDPVPGPLSGRNPGAGRVRRTVAAGASDAELGRLLAAGWHVEHLRALDSGEVEIEAVRPEDPA